MVSWTGNVNQPAWTSYGFDRQKFGRKKFILPMRYVVDYWHPTTDHRNDPDARRCRPVDDCGPWDQSGKLYNNKKWHEGNRSVPSNRFGSGVHGSQCRAVDPVRAAGQERLPYDAASLQIFARILSVDFSGSDDRRLSQTN